MKYPTYPNYKDSGVQWLGEVPGHWEVKRLKTSATYRVSNVDKLTNEDELPVRLCNYTDVYYHDQITPDMELMEATATQEEINRFRLMIDDIVITKDSEDWRDIAVPARIAATAPDLVCGYHLAIISPLLSMLDGNFLLRVLQSCAINQQFQIAASGVTRYGLPKSSIGEAILPLPPLPEQTAIADFLDRETGRIDTLVAKKRRLIVLFKEKCAALISRTVTRGLPEAAAREFGLEPHTRFQDSAIEWLGEVPEGWEVWKLSHGFKNTGSGTTPPSDNDAWYDGDIPWVTTSELRETVITYTSKKVSQDALQAFSALKVFPAGSLAIAMYGATIGRLGMLGLPATTNQACCVMFGEHALKVHFMFYWFQAFRDQVILMASGGGQPNISQEKIRSVRVACPGLGEQTAIATHLDRETAKIDRLVEKVETAIERLQEYRTALITAAVTRKIDVREARQQGREAA